MRNDLPISPKKKFKYSISFESWDEESLEAGQSDVRGYEVEDDTDFIGDILYKANTTYGIYMPVSFGTWESTEPNEDRDFWEKGIRKYYALHITNEDGTEISQEESDFISFLLSDGHYEIDKFRDYAVGGIVLGSIALGVGALITYFYFKGKKGKKGKKSLGNNRAKSVTHTIKGKKRTFPIKDAWRKDHNTENKSQKFEVPQADRYEMGGDASQHYHEIEYGEGGVARAKEVIMKKIGYDEKTADYFVSKSEKFAIWLADSILKEELREKNYTKEQYLNSNISSWGNINWQYADSIRLILDWLQHPVTPKQDLKQLSFAQAKTFAKEWHNDLQVLGGDIDFTEPEKNTILKTYPKNSDGIEYYWVFIPSNYCDLESSRMGHCGRTGYGNNLISLRSVKPYGKGHTINDSHITIAYGINDGIFYQVKGKKNNKPAEKYFPYIFDLVKSAIDGSINYLKGTNKFDENNKLTKEERVLEFNGFGSEYGDEEDYGFDDMTKEELRELYELKPTIFNDAESILQLYDAGVITAEELKALKDGNQEFDTFGNQMKLYERGIILEKPSTTFKLNYGCDDVSRLLSIDRDIRDTIIEDVLCGDAFDYLGGFDYYYDNSTDLVDNLNKENSQKVIDEIVRITGLDKSVVEKNGIEHYLGNQDENFTSDDFDTIIRALASAQNVADERDYVNYLYKAIESALEELGEVHSLNSEGVEMTIDLSNLMSEEDIASQMDYYEFTDIVNLFDEEVSRGSIDLPSFSIDDRYSPYGSREDFNEYFSDSDLESFAKGGSLRPKSTTSKKTKIKTMKPSQRKLAQGGNIGTTGISKEDYLLVVQNWVYFTFNYPMGFVKDAFDSKHLEEKFSSSYERYGSIGVLMSFWANLDGNNRRILALWIKNNYFNSASEKTKLQSISDDNYAQIITHWNMFCFNFPYGFIQNVYGDNTSHFEMKWVRAYESAGSTGAVNKFFTEMSSNNQELLTDWVYDNYKGMTFAGGGSVDKKGKIELSDGAEGRKIAKRIIVETDDAGDVVTYELEVGLFSDRKKGYFIVEGTWDEVMEAGTEDEYTEERYFYQEGGLWIQGGKVYDYDGVYALEPKLKPLMSALNLNSVDVFADGGEAENKNITDKNKKTMKYANGGNAGDWSVTDITNAKYLGVIEFEDNEGEFHNFEIMETDDRLVFGGMTNSGFIESGYIEKDGFSTDETLQSLLEDLEVYYNDGGEYTSQIVFNQRMAKGGSTKYAKGGGVKSPKDIFAEYEENESYNRHSENIVLLAEHFGSEQDVKDAKAIVKEHISTGHLTDELRKRRNKLDSKLYPKLIQALDSNYADGGEISVWNLRKGDKIKTRKGDIETIERKIESGYFTKESEYSHPFESIEFIERPNRRMAYGGRVTTNDGIIEAFLTSERELKVGNLSTHFNQYDKQMLLRNYGTLIATRKGNNVEITNVKYSRTTTIITNKVDSIANQKGMNVSYVSKFAKGGQAGKKYILLGYSATASRDSYEEGELEDVGDWDDTLSKEFSNKKDLIDYINKSIIYVDYDESHFDWETGEGKNIQTDVLCTYDDYNGYYPADEKAKELWKKGKKELFNVHYWINVQAVIPTTYKKGGKVKTIKKRVSSIKIKAEKLLEDSITYIWKSTDMGSGWYFMLENPNGGVLDTSLVLDIFDGDDYVSEYDDVEDWNSLSKADKKYYFDQYKEELLQVNYDYFKDEMVINYLDEFVEYLQKESDRESNDNLEYWTEYDDEYAEGGKTGGIEDGDSVIMYFKKDTELEIYESEDFELEEPNVDVFKKGEKFEVDIFGVDDIKYDVQFGDGSVAFIRKDNVEIVSVNGDKYAGGGSTDDDDDSGEIQEQLDELVQDFSSDEYKAFCYEHDIDEEDAEEMVNFIYSQTNNRCKEIIQEIEDGYYTGGYYEEDDDEDEYAEGGSTDEDDRPQYKKAKSWKDIENHPIVDGTSIEENDPSEGKDYWVYLKNGYCWESPNSEQHIIHEWGMKNTLREFNNSIYRCNCSQCVNERKYKDGGKAGDVEQNYEVGDIVELSESGWDNESYHDFFEGVDNVKLVITDVYTNQSEHQGFDTGVGMALYSTKTLENDEEVPFDLYDYELEYGGLDLDDAKIIVKEIDADGNTSVEYDEENDEWYWEDYSNDTYRGGFSSELKAYNNLIDYLEENNYAGGGRITKYVSVYMVQGNYGQGWEDLTAHDTYKEAKAEKIDYDKNERNYPHRVITRRVLRNDYEKGNYAEGGESDDNYGGQRNKIVTELKGMKGGLDNKAPYVFIKDGFIYVSAENGDNYADYYQYTIDEQLEDLADRYNTYWDWETAGSIVLAPIDTYAEGGEAGELKNVRGNAFYITDTSVENADKDFDSLSDTFFSSKDDFENNMDAIQEFSFNVNVKYQYNIIPAIYEQMAEEGVGNDEGNIQILGFEVDRYPKNDFESKLPYEVKDEDEDENYDEDEDDEAEDLKKYKGKVRPIYFGDFVDYTKGKWWKVSEKDGIMGIESFGISDDNNVFIPISEIDFSLLTDSKNNKVEIIDTKEIIESFLTSDKELKKGSLEVYKLYKTDIVKLSDKNFKIAERVQNYVQVENDFETNELIFDVASIVKRIRTISSKKGIIVSNVIANNDSDLMGIAKYMENAIKNNIDSYSLIKDFEYRNRFHKNLYQLINISDRQKRTDAYNEMIKVNSYDEIYNLLYKIVEANSDKQRLVNQIIGVQKGLKDLQESKFDNKERIINSTNLLKEYLKKFGVKYTQSPKTSDFDKLNIWERIELSRLISRLGFGYMPFAKGGKTGGIEDGDSVIMYFKKDTELEIYESEDFELEEPNVDVFKKGEKFEVDIFGVDDIKYDVQFGDGSVAFIRKDNVEIVSVNGDKYAGGGEVDILSLYQKDTFSDKDSELIDEAIENGDIDTTDIKEDFMGYVYDRIDKEYKDEFETEDIWEYTDEQYENGLTHKENYKKLISFLKNEDEYAGGGEVEDWMEEALASLIEETGNDELEITYVVDSKIKYEFIASDGDAEYRVFISEDDAEQIAVEQVRYNLENYPENFTQDWLMNYIDGRDFFEEALNEMNDSYIQDIESESDRKYANRLIAELVENGLLDEEDAESDNAEELAEDLKYDYMLLLTEQQLEEGNDGLDYFINNFGESETYKMVLDNNLINIDEASKDAVQEDGIANFLSSYDGETLYLSDDYVAYRRN